MEAAHSREEENRGAKKNCSTVEKTSEGGDPVPSLDRWKVNLKKFDSKNPNKRHNGKEVIPMAESIIEGRTFGWEKGEGLMVGKPRLRKKVEDPARK